MSGRSPRALVDVLVLASDDELFVLVQQGMEVLFDLVLPALDKPLHLLLEDRAGVEFDERALFAALLGSERLVEDSAAPSLALIDTSAFTPLPWQVTIGSHRVFILLTHDEITLNRGSGRRIRDPQARLRR